MYLSPPKGYGICVIFLWLSQCVLLPISFPQLLHSPYPVQLLSPLAEKFGQPNARLSAVSSKERIGSNLVDL